MDPTPLDVLAVGAHPDDVEIACAGTVARLVEQGFRVGIVDLTDGEPTPGSSGPEMRLAEAREAAATLGVGVRVTLDLPNRRLFDGFEARVALAKEFRKYRSQFPPERSHMLDRIRTFNQQQGLTRRTIPPYCSFFRERVRGFDAQHR